ncbi:MAG TPA: T9SS type A sorting domain-containing protein [Haliscomenobacter sp.]|uniref:T9SS type A sorting domain-containing protein n=1 Tax=Haliscomenobacter sp. TaxID=2717303 RepID=UPI002C87F5E8|nr:T9SS type A sorting domain-containing protein [Haliscomenobacter sp.]HOY15712.1 T9SS type A sorting domain-containing protein [Haliscomenobacter sp.]
MKHNLLFAFFLVFSLACVAQTGGLTFSSTNAKKDASVDLTDPFLDVQVPITITNTGKDTAKIIWRRLSLNGPSKWGTRVCDNNNCYDEIVSSNLDPKLRLNEPFVIAPGKKADLIMYFLPYGTAGTGKIGLHLAFAAKPDTVIASLNYEANIRSIATSTRDIQVANVQLFPNPSTDYFQINRIDNIDHLILYNVLGRKMREYPAQEGARYRMAGLPDGIYLVALVNDQKGVLRTLRVQKKGLRP